MRRRFEAGDFGFEFVRVIFVDRMAPDPKYTIHEITRNLTIEHQIGELLKSAVVRFAGFDNYDAPEVSGKSGVIPPLPSQLCTATKSAARSHCSKWDGKARRVGKHFGRESGDRPL
jgi:hypothetical protein